MEFFVAHTKLDACGEGVGVVTGVDAFAGPAVVAVHVPEGAGGSPRADAPVEAGGGAESFSARSAAVEVKPKGNGEVRGGKGAIAERDGRIFHEVNAVGAGNEIRGQVGMGAKVHGVEIPCEAGTHPQGGAA